MVMLSSGGKMKTKKNHNVSFKDEMFFFWNKPEDGVILLDCNMRRATLANPQTNRFLGILPGIREQYNKLTAKHNVGVGDCLLFREKGYTVALIFGAYQFTGMCKDTPDDIVDNTRKALEKLVSVAGSNQTFHVPIMYRHYKGLFPRLVETMNKYEEHKWLVYRK